MHYYRWKAVRLDKECRGRLGVAGTSDIARSSQLRTVLQSSCEVHSSIQWSVGAIFGHVKEVSVVEDCDDALL
jgi:hypothetical protein